MDPWTLIALALAVDGLAGLAGGLLSDRWLARHQAALTGFAAGALLAAVFLDVLPESLARLGPVALRWAFGSFIALALVEWIFGHHHATESQARVLPATLLAGDALHNIGDGAAVAAAFLVSPRVGLGVALAVIAHEVPQEVGDYAVLRGAGFSRARALVALAGVQLTAVLGALGVAFAAGRLESLLGVVLSVAAGSFLYIGATDLLPDLKTGRTPAGRLERIVGFLGGTAAIALLTALEARA